MILQKLWQVSVHVGRKLCPIQCARMSSVKYLNVAEKNDAAKTIAGHLSGGNSRRREGLSQYNKIYEFQTALNGQNVNMVMTSVSGHLLGLDFPAAYRGWETTNPLDLFSAPVQKICPENGEKIKATLEREVRGCRGLIIWTDCDREGENIGYEIIDVCRAVVPRIPVFRAKFSEITTAAVRRALNNLGQPDKRQSDAVDTRSELDLRTGAAFTRFQSLRLQKVFPADVQTLVSYGSCQFPTLGFVAHRYREIENFVPQPFWKIRVNHTKDGLTVEFNWERNRLFDQSCVEAIHQLCQVAEPPAQVKSVQTKPKSKWRPQPMDTVELEKLSSRKLKLSAKRTMTIAEKLYQQGYISYPRTETNQFSREIDLAGIVRGHEGHPDWGAFATRVLEWGPDPRNGKKSDQAHPPIHPTKAATDLSGDDKRVYDLIARHFLATLSRDAKGSETVVQIMIANEQFSASGLVILERNYLDVYPYDNWTAKAIHNYAVDEIFTPTELSVQGGSTTAPSLLTEADLIALMEKHGIGTDATHAEHINTIKERGYIGVIERGFLIPGTLGMGIVEGYEAMALTLTEPKLRANLEKDLKAICEGRRQPEDVLREQIQIYKEAYEAVVSRVKKLDDALSKRFEKPPVEPTEPIITAATLERVTKCSTCTHDMLLRQKRNGVGQYLSCISYPGCKNSIWFPEDVVKKVTVLPDNCPRCRVSKMLEFKFKQFTTYALLDSHGPTYSGCIKCDTKLLEVLGIREMNGNNGRRPPPGNDSRPWNSGGGAPPPPPRPRPPPSSSSWNSSSNSRPDPPNNRPRPPPSSSSWNSNSSSRPDPPNSRNGPGNFQPPNQWNSTSSSASSSNSWNSTSSNWNNSTGQNTWGKAPSSSSSWQGNGNTNNNKGNTTAKRPRKPIDMNCPKCGMKAAVFTTKKEGPNKDRQFYKCNNTTCTPPCNFFQWVDEVPQNIHEPAASAPKAKRKCGICKQEGHTRKNCPQLEDDL